MQDTTGVNLHLRLFPAMDVRTIVDYCAKRDIPCIVVGEDNICVCRPKKSWEAGRKCSS